MENLNAAKNKSVQKGGQNNAPTLPRNAFFLDTRTSSRFCLSWKREGEDQKSDNLQYNTVGQWVHGTIVPPSDGPMFILIDWE